MTKPGKRKAIGSVVRLWSKSDPAKYWEIEQADEVLTKRSGTVGESIRTSQKRCRDWFFASIELERTVVAQLTKGFSRRRPASANASRGGVAKRREDAAAAILDELDRAQASGDFPDLESFTWIVVGARMHLFALRARGKWGLVIEEVTYAQSARRAHEVLVRLHRFGNAFRRRGAQWLRPFETEQIFVEQLIGPDESIVCVAAGARRLRVWGRSVPITQKPADYRRAGVRLKYPALVQKRECLALLAKTERDGLFAPHAEVLRWALPGVKHLDTLATWKHPDGAISESATFRKIAKRLVAE